MLMKTHLAFGMIGFLILLPEVSHKLIFFFGVLVATLLPDIDSYNSYLGNRWYLRPFQWATKHRGALHSFTFCILVSIGFAFFIPILALPFFLGYSIHLFSDSFTHEGIRPFWPLKDECTGKIKVGGTIEQGLFYGALLVCVILFIRFFI
ncbi:MAG: metal-dependent hydrolase [Nanoarchaeota archaeon]